jgi:hypothetical protein
MCEEKKSTPVPLDFCLWTSGTFGLLRCARAGLQDGCGGDEAWQEV